MPTETIPGVLVVRTPDGDPLPLVFDSPHSGFDFPPGFRPVAPREAMLTTCDRFVDELWGAAPDCGATLIAALFPRAFIDPNRSDSDLDPDLLVEPWRGKVERSDYTRRGMGLIRRFALPGVPLYGGKLANSEVEARLDGYYRPYRNRLSQSIEEAFARHGAVWHCNCHSMKSHGNAMNTDAGAARPDFVLSDRHGRTSDSRFVDWLAGQLKRQGFSVSVNEPYQGGDLVASLGRPAGGRSSLQIEINRVLYLDEATYEKSSGFAPLARSLAFIIRAMGDFVRSELSTRSG